MLHKASPTAAVESLPQLLSRPARDAALSPSGAVTSSSVGISRTGGDGSISSDNEDAGSGSGGSDRDAPLPAPRPRRRGPLSIAEIDRMPFNPQPGWDKGIPTL